MLAKLGQDFWKTVRAAGISVVWRRIPITTVTVTLVIGFWLYDYASVSSAATNSAPRPAVAVESVPPIATQVLSTQSVPTKILPVSQATATEPTDRRERTRRAHPASREAKNGYSAFRQKSVGKNEVDYVARDVTIRLFTPGPKLTPTPAARLGRERHIGKDVTVRYFESETGMAKKMPSSAAGQSAER
jgi:hypothetical protein